MKSVNRTMWFFLIAVLMSGFSRAEPDQISRAAITPLLMSEADIVKLSQSHAEKYGLKESELKKYFSLMQGYLGFWNPSIDPILALGMFAETESERTRYAELYVQKEVEMTDRVLTFQRSYRDAFAKLYPDASMTDERLLAPYVNHRKQHRDKLFNKKKTDMQVAEGDKLRWFVDDNCPSCSDLIRMLLQKTAPINNVRIDIFVVSAKNDNDVREWAKRTGIDPGWVITRRVTLNRDDGTLAALSKSSGTSRPKLPALFLQRNEQFYQLRGVVNL